MKLIIGIGNPEKRYDGTRHNVGFLILDAIAGEENASYKHSDKFKADIAEITLSGEKVLLVKPTTYYNLVGESVRAIIDFYKIESTDVLIVHDELALPFGTIRTRQGGSDAGNNGVKSLNQHLGPDTQRLRIGVWNELRDKVDDAVFVLSKFSSAERQHLDAITTLASKQIHDFTSGKMSHQTLRVNMVDVE